MQEIKLGGKTRKLRFSHIAMKTMEEYYSMSFAKIFNEVDVESIDNMGVMIWACMRRFDKTLTIDEVDEWIDDSIEDEETTYEEIGEKIKTVFNNSTLAKQQGGTKNKKGA
ncbi:hypothetical protein [Alteribacillus sp. YIM 98480]|uniref:hypothetical protein n=1 Tax=Alteribacillus sp. YIM 98480 TaxID=2606599 RepID=UPI00131BD39F|nr:hypothetical protein [Alteribacillus sp. YIM 98480]